MKTKPTNSKARHPQFKTEAVEPEVTKHTPSPQKQNNFDTKTKQPKQEPNYTLN